MNISTAERCSVRFLILIDDVTGREMSRGHIPTNRTFIFNQNDNKIMFFMKIHLLLINSKGPRY